MTHFRDPRGERQTATNPWRLVFPFSGLLGDQDGSDVLLVKVIPGPGGGIHDDGHQAQQHVQDHPAGADVFFMKQNRDWS